MINYYLMSIFANETRKQYITIDNPTGLFNPMNTGFISVETIKYLYDNTPVKRD